MDSRYLLDKIDQLQQKLNIFHTRPNNLGEEDLNELSVLVSHLKKNVTETGHKAPVWDFKSLFENMNGALTLQKVIYNEHGEAIDFKITDINSQAAAILSLNRYSVKGLKATEIYGTFRPANMELYAMVAESGQSATFETYDPRIACHLHIKVFSPAPGYFATLLSDISERKKLEQEHNQTANIIENIEELITIKDSNGIYQFANPSFANLVRLHKNSIIGKSDVELFGPKAGIEKQHQEQQIKETTSFEETYFCGNAWHSFKTTKIPYKNQGGISGIISISRNITERKQAEETIQQYTRELETKNKELEQFVYIASHDLKAPLRNISSLIELLTSEHEGRLDPQATPYIQHIQNSTTRMQQLIEALLDYSRLGKEREMGTVDCYRLCQDILHDLGTIIRETGVQVQINNLPTIKGYDTELRLLFQNLIHNGLKFYKKNTTPQIEVSAREINGYWKFSVKDNGLGIDNENKEKIFMIFQKHHQNHEGVGIGLAHCKKIVELHGGEIWVDSVVGAGSTFNFTIPKV